MRELLRLLAAFEQPPREVVRPVFKKEVLSKREVELLSLIAAGCSNKDIAGQLSSLLAPSAAYRQYL